MSIIKTIPQSSRYIQVDAIFTATFNNPTLGRYDFTIPGNQAVVLLEPLTATSIYLIDRYSFSSNIPEGDFLSSIDIIPTAQLTKRIDGLQIYQRPIPCINYVDNAESIAYFQSRTSAKEQVMKDALTVTFRGRLIQVPATVGLTEIKALLSISLYEIIDQNFTQQFKQPTENKPQNIQVF